MGLAEPATPGRELRPGERRTVVRAASSFAAVATDLVASRKLVRNEQTLDFGQEVNKELGVSYKFGSGLGSDVAAFPLAPLPRLPATVC